MTDTNHRPTNEDHIQGDRPPIEVEHILLDLVTKSGMFMDDFIAFLKEHRSELGLQSATDIVTEYFQRVWPTELPVSMIVSPGSFDDFLRIMFRPPVDGPMAASFAAKGMAPAFTAYLKQGRLIVDGFMPVEHIRARPFERYVSGQVHLTPSLHLMSQADLGKLAALTNPRQQTALELHTWLACLDWQQSLALIGQESARYEAYYADENGLLYFLTRSNDKLGRLIRKGLAMMVAAPVADSRSPDKWEPDTAQRPRFVRLGSIVKGHRLGPNSKLYKKLTEDRPDSEQDNLSIITIRLDASGNSKEMASLVPEEGFLLTSVAGDIKPISSARRAIHRLLKGRGHNWNLADYLFRVDNAALPENDIQYDLDGLPFGNLNDQQRDAVLKCLAAIDFAFVHGPPGTGKTTVTAAYCYIEVQNGRRVLIASQSNDAVGNVLTRLQKNPAVRPLRVGSLRHIEPDSHIFVEDQVLVLWLKAVGYECQQQLERNKQLETKIRDAQAAFPNLDTIIGNYERTVQETTARAEARTELENRKEQLIAARRGLTENDQQLKRDRTVTEELNAWASNPGGRLPALELLSKASLSQLAGRTAQAIGRKLSAVLARINNAGTTGGTSKESQNAETAGGGSLKKLMTKVKASAKSVPGPRHWGIPWASEGNVESGFESWLELATFQRAAAAAKKVYPLLFTAITACQSDTAEEASWTQVCRDIQSCLSDIFDTDIPLDLEDMAASLRPEVRWQAVLKNLALLCETLTGPCQEIFAEALGEIRGQAEAQKTDIAAKASKVRAQLDENQMATREIEAEIREAQYGLDDLQGRLNEHLARWSQLWPVVCPDLEAAPTAPPEINRDAIDSRRRDFDAWLSEQQARRDRQKLWDSIRTAWITRIADPRTAENKDLKSDYVKHANVVGVTCLAAGQKSFYEDDNFKPFDAVVVDEVSKATPPELLMPMMCGRKVILVGDQRQLPPMFKQKESSFTEAVAEGQIAAEDFERYRKLITASFFQELYEAAPDSIRQALVEQFRMHPQIMAIINQFYDGLLTAAGGSAQLGKLRRHYLSIRDRQGGWFLEPDQHVLWVDSGKDACGKVTSEDQVGSSKLNWTEIKLVIAGLKRLNSALQKRGYGAPRDCKATSAEDGLTVGEWVKRLMPRAADQTITDLFTRRQIKLDGHTATPERIVNEGSTLTLDARMKVGVITFYGAQLGQIRKHINKLRIQDPRRLEAIDVRTNTVDKFQGQEMPIVIVSLVRASQNRRLGDFVKEYRRINVAFSRAQNLLIIVGAERTFRNAIVELPSMDGKTTKKAPVYRNIYNLITQFGGRRYAKQILAA